MKICSSLILLLFSFSVFSFEFKKGEGSQFTLTSKGHKADLNIYVADVEKNNMAVEFHFGTGGMLSTNMWQQFNMELKGRGPIKVTKGYIQTSKTKKPEIMKDYMFTQNRGVQINDFLFSSQDEINGSFMGDEKVEIPAGTIIAKHYKKESNGQVVDFWISDEVKPIGLVKLISKSDKEEINNYSIELKSLLRNVKPTIDPSKAVPMSEATEKLLKVEK